jgi:C1A family cysteine protease
MQPMTVRHHGWIPDSPDKRDVIYQPPHALLMHLPKRVDLRPWCPPVYNQGSLNSCSANAVSAAIEFGAAREGLGRLRPSRLFMYYNERVLHHRERTDSGAHLRDAVKTAANTGSCRESSWPYLIDKFAVRPPASCYKEAPAHRVVSYRRMRHDLRHLKSRLASGFPFVFGFRAHQSFHSAAVARSGRMPMPKKNGDPLVGNHAGMAVGYNDASRRFIIRNSWGPDWGLGGYFTMPFEFLLDRGYADDFWTIFLVE